MAELGRERAYTTLREELDALGYRQALGIESAALAQNLLSDLVATTDNYQELAERQSVLERELLVWQHQVEPLKRENSRLVRENNDLHKAMIGAAESAEAEKRRLEATLSATEASLAELRFVNTQYDADLAAKEATIDAQNERLNQVLNDAASGAGPGGVIGGAVPKIEVSRPLPAARRPPRATGSGVGGGSGSGSGSTNRQGADLLAAAETRLADLRAQLRARDQARSVLEAQIATLDAQLATRDAEIDRLGKALEGGRPDDVVAMEAVTERLRLSESLYRNECEALTRQLQDAEARQEALSSELAVAERQLSEMEELSARNHDLETAVARLEADVGARQTELDRLKQFRGVKARVERDRDFYRDETNKLRADLTSANAALEAAEEAAARAAREAARTIERLEGQVREREASIAALEDHLGEVGTDNVALKRTAQAHAALQRETETLRDEVCSGVGEVVRGGGLRVGGLCLSVSVCVCMCLCVRVCFAFL